MTRVVQIWELVSKVLPMYICRHFYYKYGVLDLFPQIIALIDIFTHRKIYGERIKRYTEDEDTSVPVKCKPLINISNSTVQMKK